METQATGVQCVAEMKTVGVQRYLEFVTEVNHVGKKSIN